MRTILIVVHSWAFLSSRLLSLVLGCLSLGLDWILNNVQMKKKIVIIIVLTPEVITSHYFMSDGSDVM